MSVSGGLKTLFKDKIKLLEVLLKDCSIFKYSNDNPYDIIKVEKIYASMMFEHIFKENQYGNISMLEIRAMQHSMPHDFHVMFAEHAVLMELLDSL